MFFVSSRRRHTRWPRDWSSDVCSSDLILACTAGVMLFSGNQGMEWTGLYATWDDAGADPQGMFVDGVAGFAGNIGIPESTAQVFGALIKIGRASCREGGGVWVGGGVVLAG